MVKQKVAGRNADSVSLSAFKTGTGTRGLQHIVPDDWKIATAYVTRIPEDQWKTDGLMDAEVEAMKLQTRKVLTLQGALIPVQQTKVDPVSVKGHVTATDEMSECMTAGIVPI
jgi:hypothetical protein